MSKRLAGSDLMHHGGKFQCVDNIDVMSQALADLKEKYGGIDVPWISDMTESELGHAFERLKARKPQEDIVPIGLVTEPLFCECLLHHMQMRMHALMVDYMRSMPTEACHTKEWVMKLRAFELLSNAITKLKKSFG